MSAPQQAGDLIFPQPLGHSEMPTVLPSSSASDPCSSSAPHFPQRMFSTSIPQSEHVYFVNLFLLLLSVRATIDSIAFCRS